MKNKARKYIIVLMAVACVFSTLPFSIGAKTPIVEGATYTYVTADYIEAPLTDNDVVRTKVRATFPNLSLEGDYEGLHVTTDVISAEIVEIGYINTYDIKAFTVRTYGDFIIYIAGVTPIPMYYQDTHVNMLVFTVAGNIGDPTDDITYVGFEFNGQTIYLPQNNEISITLTDISESDPEILGVALQAFSTKLTAKNYADMTLVGYSNIMNVFINNAKQFFVVDNPFVVISLVVFGTAILLAMFTLIFKFFRRY